MKITLVLSVCVLAGCLSARAGEATSSNLADMKRGDTPKEEVDTTPLSKAGVAGGVVHDLPQDLSAALIADGEALRLWEAITPLARNEWICWVDTAKKAETRRARIERVREELKAGMRRPCCWPGCSHRAKNGKIEAPGVGINAPTPVPDS